jgi:hypothetical protein
MAHNNNPHFFPSLRAAKLESFAHTWAKYFTFMKRISLYQVPVDGFDYSVKYVMFFELSEISKTNGFDEHDESFIELLEGPDVLRCLDTKPSHFKEVYKDTPLDNFFDEWRFVTKLPEGIVEKYSWILFSRTSDRSIRKKILPVQEDKIKCQKIASDIWKESLLDIKYMKMHPDIKKITGKRYKDKTIHNWFSEVAPPDVKRPGRRSKNYEKKQIAIYKKLKIEVPKK